MMMDAAWADLAEVVVVNSAAADKALLRLSDDGKTKALLISLPSAVDEKNKRAAYTEITSTVVRVVRQQGCSNDDDDDESSTPAAAAIVRLHPLLYEFLTLSALEIQQDSNNKLKTSPPAKNTSTIFIAPLPMPPSGYYYYDSADDNDDDSDATIPLLFCAQPVETIEDLPISSRVTLQILCDDTNNDSNTDDDAYQRRIAFALQGRLIRQGTLILLMTAPGYAIAVVKDIKIKDDACWNGEGKEEAVVYRVAGDPSTFSLIITHSATSECSAEPNEQDKCSNQILYQDCPGYERQVKDLVDLLQMTLLLPNTTTAHVVRAAAPTGILLTGCAGVGKTRLAACVAAQLQSFANVVVIVHWVSVHDLVLMATWATEDDLLNALRPPDNERTADRPILLILDDLDVAGIENDESSSYTSNDQERRLVRNSILQVIDEMVQVKTAAVVLGIGQSAAQLPAELVKVGRLEKGVSMFPPSQSQREKILYSMLAQAEGVTVADHCSSNSTGATTKQWAELLATLTAGCVAADLRRLCADAWNRSLARTTIDLQSISTIAAATTTATSHVSLTWEDLSEAARNCIPSQLAALDVTKPPNFLHDCSMDDWPRIHELSWRSFAGYDNIKKRVYRTVVVPWRRLFLNTNDSSTMLLPERSHSIAPPSGVLFHGESGCGKTLAARCLGSSLGLPMIKVRAADVLDKWLGGSEAAIRSLFQRARAAAPSILFCDDIDAIASNRANAEDGGTADVMSRLLSTLLNEMDGVSSGQDARVLVVACTNRVETLDAALLRPGRLEEHILLPKPLLVDVKAILRHYLSSVPLHDSLDLDSLADDLVQRLATGSDIEGVCREAVFRALHRHPKHFSEVFVTEIDIQDAMGALNL